MADADGKPQSAPAATADQPAVGLLSATAPSLLSTEQVYDAIGPAYEAAYAGLPPLAASLAWLLAHLAPTSKIVDLGCGTGNPVASTLAAAGHSVLGLDISSAMIAAARERVPSPNAVFEQGDTRAFLLKTPPRTYDAVTVYLSLIHGVTQKEIRECIAQIFGVLKPGGLFVWATVPEDAEGKLIDWHGRQYAVSSLGAAAAVQAVRDAGFEVVYDGVTKFRPKAAEAGICAPEEEWEEEHLFVYARKPVDV